MWFPELRPSSKSAHALTTLLLTLVASLAFVPFTHAVTLSPANCMPPGQRTMDMTTWARVRLNPRPCVLIGAPGLGGNPDPMLMAALNAWPGRNGIVGDMDDNYLVSGGGALVGTFDVLRYNATMRTHTAGGADFLLAYRDNDPRPTKPANLRWVNVITTNKPGRAGGDPMVPYIDWPIGQDPGIPFYYHPNDPMPGLREANNSNLRNEGPDGIPGTPDDRAPGNGPDGLPNTPDDIRAIDYLFQDAPTRDAWSIHPATRRLVRMHAAWRAKTFAVTWDGNAVPPGPSTLVQHEGVEWGFDLWPLHNARLVRNPRGHGTGNDRSTPTLTTPSLHYDGVNSLSFQGITAEHFQLNDGSRNPTDALLGADIVIDPTSLRLLEPFDAADRPGDGGFFTADPQQMQLTDEWAFNDTTLKIIKNGMVQMRADLVDLFLLIGGEITQSSIPNSRGG